MNRAAMIERAKEFALSEARVSATVAEDMADFALQEIEAFCNEVDTKAQELMLQDNQDDSQLRNTQTALRNLYKAVQKSRSVNDPLGMATAMEEAGKWF